MSPEELPPECEPEVKICEDWRDETKPEKDPSDDQIEICCRPTLVDCDNSTDQKTVNVFIELGDSVLKGRKNNDSLCPDQKPPKECQDLLDKNLILLIDAKFDNPPRKGEEVPPAGCDGADSKIPKDKDDSVGLGFPMRIPLGNLKNLMDDAIKAKPEDGGGDPCSDPTNTNRSVKIPLFSQSFPFKRTNCLPKACANAQEFHKKFCAGDYPNNQWTDQQILQWFTKYKQFLKTKGLNIINFFPFIPPGKNDSKRCVGALCFKTDGNAIPPSTGFSELCAGALSCSGPWLSEIGDPPQDLKDCFNKKNADNPVIIGGWNCPTPKMRQLCNMLKCIESKDPGGAKPDEEDPSVAIIDISATLITEDGKKSKAGGDCLDGDSPRMEITTGENGSSTDMVIRIGNSCKDPLQPYGVVFSKSSDECAEDKDCQCTDMTNATQDALKSLKDNNPNRIYGDIIPCQKCADLTKDESFKSSLDDFCKESTEIGYCCIVGKVADIPAEYAGWANNKGLGGKIENGLTECECKDKEGIFLKQSVHGNEENAMQFCSPTLLCCLAPPHPDKKVCAYAIPSKQGTAKVEVTGCYTLDVPKSQKDISGSTCDSEKSDKEDEFKALLEEWKTGCDTNIRRYQYFPLGNKTRCQELIKLIRKGYVFGCSSCEDGYKDLIRNYKFPENWDYLPENPKNRLGQDIKYTKSAISFNIPISTKDIGDCDSNTDPNSLIDTNDIANAIKKALKDKYREALRDDTDIQNMANSFVVTNTKLIIDKSCSGPYSLGIVSALDQADCKQKAEEALPCCSSVNAQFIDSMSITQDGSTPDGISIDPKTGQISYKGNQGRCTIIDGGGTGTSSANYICEIKNGGKVLKYGIKRTLQSDIDKGICAQCADVDFDSPVITDPSDPTQPEPPADTNDPKSDPKPIEVKKCARIEVPIVRYNRELKKQEATIQFPLIFIWDILDDDGNIVDTITIKIENADEFYIKFKSLPFPGRKALIESIFFLPDQDFSYEEPFNITPADCRDSTPQNPIDTPVNPTDPKSKDRDPTNPKNKEECAGLLKELELTNAEVDRLSEQLKVIQEDFKNAKAQFIKDCVSKTPIVRSLPWGSVFPWSKECQALIDKMLNNYPGGNFKLPLALDYIKPPPKVSKKYKKTLTDLTKAKDKARELDLKYKKCIQS